MKPILTLIYALLLVWSVGAQAQSHQPLAEEFRKLDLALENSSEYVAMREQRIDHYRGLLAAEKEPKRTYEYAKRLYEEYFTYNFDLALTYGNVAIEAARELGDETLLNEGYLAQAKLYTIAGMYAEALGAFERVEVERLAPQSLCDYYLANIHFNRDFKEYSKDVEMSRECGRLLKEYRHKVYTLPRSMVAVTEGYLADSLSTRLLDYYDAEDYTNAELCARELLENTDPDRHDYAIASYYLSMVCERLGKDDEQLLWLIRSATTDTRFAIKDNASLCVLASKLSVGDDIDRAFRYIRTSIDDATFYNAKLRQWQVAVRMNTIEQAYHQSVAEQQRHQRQMTIVAMLLVAFLLGVCIYVVMLLRRTAKAQRALKAKNQEIESMNEALKQTNHRLSELNLSIAEANMVKEEYIGLFLSMCSDYIDKIAHIQRRVRKGIKSGSIAELNREFPSSDIIDAEKEHFYEVFDSAFLNLYPNFVEEFNSLLEPDGQIELRKGERLNTELRIFALIRLGITDSSKIALLLHYSVNTIYNYRAKVKNRAKCDRDDFEHIIRTIGSFKA